MNFILLVSIGLLQPSASTGWKPVPRNTGTPIHRERWPGTATVSNSGRFLVGLSSIKALSVIDLRTGRTLFYEKVLLCTKKGGGYIALTDSQFPHVREKIDHKLSLYGKTLAVLGPDSYLVQLFGPDSGKGSKDALAVVYPKKRGIDSNVILGFFPHSYNLIASVASEPGGIGVTVASKWRNEPHEYQHWLIPTGKMALRNHSKFHLFASGVETDMSWLTKRIMFLSNNAHGWQVLDFSGKSTSFSLPPAPNTSPAYYGYARFVGKGMIAWWEGQHSAEASRTYLATSAGGWREIGKFAVVGLSLDHKLLVVRDSNNSLWLKPVAAL